MNEKKVVDKELLKLNPYCPECGCDIGADETGKMKINYCPDCGTELVQPSRCVVCNNPIHATAEFCTGCGFIAIR